MLHFGLIAKVSNLLLLFTVNTIVMLVIAVIDTRYNTNCLETVSTVEAHNYFFFCPSFVFLDTDAPWYCKANMR